MIRVRENLYYAPKGYGIKNGVILGSGDRVTGQNRCEDLVDSGDNHPFYVTKITQDGGILNSPPSNNPYFVDYRVDAYDQLRCFDHLSLLDVPSDTDAATQGAARSNPSRPYVDVMTNILELSDYFHLVKNKGDEIIRDLDNQPRKKRRPLVGDKLPEGVSRLNLIYQFGVAPLVGDLVKLLKFQEQVERRISEIRRLIGQRGLRRTVDLGTFSGNRPNVWFVPQSSGRFITCYLDYTTTQRVWAHCRWLPTFSPEMLSTPKAMRDIAKKAVLGLTVDASTSWELMPWSWLLDWCGNVGQYFAANRNIIPAVLDSVTIMRHTKTEVVSHGTQVEYDEPVTMEPIHYTLETKSRVPSTVLPTAHFPFLSGSQMGILSSLAVART